MDCRRGACATRVVGRERNGDTGVKKLGSRTGIGLRGGIEERGSEFWKAE